MRDRVVIDARHKAIKKAYIPRDILKVYDVEIKNGYAILTKKKGIV